MNEEGIKGAAQSTVGKVESFAGATVGSPKTEARGDARQAEGQTRQALGSVQDAVGQVADKATAAFGQLSDQARDVYGRASDNVRDVAGRVDPFVKDQPYVALAIAGVAGFIAGMLMNNSGAKVIYLKQHH